MAEEGPPRPGGGGRPDTSRVFVDVGLGFHVECTWTEALDFCTQKEEAFTQRVEKRTKEIADIKAQIKLVVEGVRELMSLPPEPERRAALQ